MKKLIAVLGTAVLLISLSSCAVTTNDETNGGTGKSASVTTKAPETESSADKTPTFGSTITFDDLEITFATDVTWTAVDNEFSDNAGADVIAVPVTIKNVKDETNSLNIFYYKFFGSKGTELDSVAFYFDDDVYSLGELRSGASIDTLFHILYDGDGDYFIEFSNFTDKIEVKLPIAK